MTRGELDYLTGRLMALVDLNEVLSIAGVVMIAIGASPMILPTARAHLLLALKRFAEARGVSIFGLVPAGLMLLYVVAR